MTNEQLFDLILIRSRRLGDPVLRGYVADELRSMLMAWERSPFLPWFLEKLSSGAVTVNGTQTVNLPSDFLLLVEDTNVFLTNSEGTKLKLVRAYHEDLELEFANVDEGVPGFYDIFGGQFWFGPVPDGAYSFSFKYYGSTTPPPDNETEVDNPWVLNAEDLVITAAAQRLTDYYIKDTERANALQERASILRSELHKYSESRKHNDMDYKVDR